MIIEIFCSNFFLCTDRVTSKVIGYFESNFLLNTYESCNLSHNFRRIQIWNQFYEIVFQKTQSLLTKALPFYRLFFLDQLHL